MDLPSITLMLTVQNDWHYQGSAAGNAEAVGKPRLCVIGEVCQHFPLALWYCWQLLRQLPNGKTDAQIWTDKDKWEATTKITNC